MRAEGSAAPQRVWAESPSDASRARADTRAGPMPMAMRFSQVPRFVIPVAWQAHHVAAGGVHGSWVANVARRSSGVCWVGRIDRTHEAGDQHAYEA
jgi:hypothetical protein